MKLKHYRADDPPPWANDPSEKEPTVTEAPSHLIRASAGRIRVLRTIAGLGLYLLAYDVPRGVDYCRVCGCTNIYGCAGGCSWANVSQTLCTRCLEKELLP